MRLENLSAQDARRVLCERKYFGMRPQPLEQYLYAMKLSQCAERVFWLHWDAGYRRGDFTSEVPLSEVARRVKANTSSVTRAYQLLKRHGLIRRQDPGRDPSRPFCQATAVTEVLLPREALKELLGSPDRLATAGHDVAAPAHAGHDDAQAGHLSKPVANDQAASKDAADAVRVHLDGLRTKFSGRASEKVFAKLTVDERTELFTAQRQAQAGQPSAWHPATNTKLDADEVLWLQDFLTRYANDAQQRPVTAAQPKTPAAAKPGARPISTFTLAYLRKQISMHVAGAEVDQRFREIVWAVEEGSLIKFEPRFAVNIAVKKLKEGVWTRPNRMPPNWRRAVA